MTADTETRRWEARPVRAALIRVLVFAIPLAGSVVFVHYASKLVSVPTSSFLLFASWWVGMSGGATVVLWVIDKVSRRLMPLVALYRLSLVFPDEAPSRFRVAMRSNNVDTLEERIAEARELGDDSSVTAAELLLSLVADLNSHDPLTRGHSDRVRAYSQMIGKELHLSPDDLDRLNWAALLHDIGKLEVPTEILAKPGRPSDEEWSVLRRHPELGKNMIAPLESWLGEWSSAVSDHHERWDGKGYPAGTAGDEIALAGRIVAVADVFDVITSARSYKSAFAATAARDEIAKCASTQFDPRVVRAFLNVSLGRMRLIMGPLSWLAHAPMLGRLPLTPAVGAAGASLASVAVAVTGGLISAPPEASLASTTPITAPAALHRNVLEDHQAVVGVERARGGARVTSVELIGQPSVGVARLLSGHRIRFTPPPDYNGTVAIRYRACWAGADCANGVIHIDVAAVNDPPSARDDRARTVSGTAVSVPVLANDSDPDGDALAVLSVRELSSGRASIAGGKAMRWSPPSGFHGTARFRYVVGDGHGGTAEATVSIDVAPAIDRRQPSAGKPSPPVAAPPPPAPHDKKSETPPAAPPPGDNAPRAADDRVSVPEGGTAVVDVLANDSDPDEDALSLVSVDAPDHGRARLLGDRIEYSAPGDFVGQTTFAYTIADPQGAKAEGTIHVSVLLVNSAPTFTAGPSQSVLEDSGARTVPGWATHIGPGAASEEGQAVTFAVSTDATALFAVEPRLAADGTLSFTPAANANGDATVTVRAHDDGGTTNGGTDTSPPATFAIAIRPVNDAPSFTAGPDQRVGEDAGSSRVAGWATDISAGPADEKGQKVTFQVTNDAARLFTSSGQPRVDADGALLFTPAANAIGSATVTVRVHDDGGTADGGVDASPPQTFMIAIRPVNDAPSFTVGANQTTTEDSAAKTVTGWVTQISPGPADENAQTVDFLVSAANTALFSAQPAVTPGGTLTYTPAPNANGTTTVTVRAHDDGGTANGGVDTSAPQTFTIAITPVNDPPTAVDDAASVAEDSTTGVTFDVLANDTDIDAGDTLSVGSFDASTIANGQLTPNGGGSFTYVPDSGFSGTETFTYVVADGAAATDAGTVTITVTAVPHAPVAGDDAYTVLQDTPLVIPAPGVLGNDGDADGDTVTLHTTPVSGPSDGGLSLSADGSFTYTPNTGFTGSDSFTYRVDDGTGRTADGIVTITVTASAPLSSTLYFQPSGPTADLWDLATVLPPAAGQNADLDADGKAGLTIKDSDGKETITEGQKYQTWTYTAPTPLILNGPVTLDVWSSTGLFGSLHKGEIWAYLYNCTAGGVICTKIASNHVLENPWNTSLLTWGERTITIGSVNITIPAGNELRVKLLFHHHDLWLMTSASYPSALLVTLG